MSEQAPQSPAPEGAPDMGRTVSQQASAAMGGPDTFSSVPNPLRAEQATERDYEASYKGLMKRYNEDRQQWQEERTQYQQSVDALTKKFGEWEANLMGQQQAKPEPPKQEQKQKPAEDGTADFLEAMAQSDAIRHRDGLLFEYISSNPGLGLAQFRDNIPVVAPTLNDDGTVDDSGQRKAIEKFINGIKGVRTQQQQSTQQAMTEGWTPGVAPGPPNERDTYDAKVDRYYRLKEQLGNMDPDAPQNEVAKIQKEYYALQDEIGWQLPGQTKPWMDNNEIVQSVNELWKRVGHLQGFMRPQG